MPPEPLHPPDPEDDAGLSLELRAECFLRDVRDEHDAAALRRLERTPAIAGVNVFAAAAAGDEEGVRRFLAADPALATAVHSQRAFSAIVYAGASPLPADSPALARIARALLDAGADPNSGYPGTGEGPPQSALYRACVRGHAGVARALLERGARTQDGESIYHAAEHNRVTCLEALLEHGADLGSRQEPWGNTPLYFLAGYPEGGDRASTAHAGMRWLLDHGADPNVTSGSNRETPLHQVARVGGGLAVATALLDAGADPDAARADGRTPCAIAFRHGLTALVDLMRAHGART